MIQMELPDVSHKTLGGYAFQNLIRDNDRGVGADHRNSLWNIIDSLEKESLIIMSYTDPDSRIGMSDNKSYFDSIPEDYEEAISKILGITQCTKLIILDWYVIAPRKVSEQTCEPERRVKNRDRCIGAIKNLLEKFGNLEFHTLSRREKWENESGFCLDESVMMDGVHLNFAHETCSELKEIFKGLIECNI